MAGMRLRACPGAPVRLSVVWLCLFGVVAGSLFRGTAVFDTQGVKGTITIERPPGAPTGTLTVQLSGLQRRATSYAIHTLPVPYATSQGTNVCDLTGPPFNPHNLPPCAGGRRPCATSDLSGRFATLAGLDALSSVYTASELSLSGADSVLGRSIVLRGAAGAFVCATIDSQAEETTTLEAVLSGSLYGTVLLQQDRGSADVRVLARLSLEASLAGAASRPAAWLVHEGEAVDNRCSDADVGPVSLDLGAALGPLELSTLSTAGIRGAVFGTVPDTSLDGLALQSIVAGSAPLRACAVLKPIQAAGASARFAAGPVQGEVNLVQRFPLDSTRVVVSLAGLRGVAASSLTIAALPVSLSAKGPTSASGDGGGCALIGELYNPGNLSGVACSGSSPPDWACPVGRIPQTTNQLAGLDAFGATFTDGNTPLFGPHSVLDRSVAILDANARVVACATLVADPAVASAPRRKAGDGDTAVATFRSGRGGGLISGDITFRHDTGRTGTTVVVGLRGPPGTYTWHVHTEPVVGNDCGSTGAHFNPFEVCTDPSCGYLEACGRDEHQYACEVGDLAGKHGAINPTADRVFTDVHLPLSGTNAIVDRSITLHRNGARVACATIASQLPTKRSLNNGAVAGIVVGILLATLLLVVLVYFYLKSQQDTHSRYSIPPEDLTTMGDDGPTDPYRLRLLTQPLPDDADAFPFDYEPFE